MENNDKDFLKIEGCPEERIVTLEAKSVGSSMSFDSMFVNADPSLLDMEVLSPGDVIELANKTYKVVRRMHRSPANEERLVYLVREGGLDYVAVTNAENEHDVLKLFSEEGKNIFPSIVGYSEETYQILIMEYCGENSTGKGKKLSTVELATLLVDILLQLEMLSRRGLCHRNVSPRTICKRPGDSSEKEMTNTLVAFYLTHKSDAKTNTAVIMKNPVFCSLEVQQGGEYTYRDDLISLLYTISFLVNGKLPWNEKMKSIVIREKKKSFEVVKSLPEGFVELGQAILNVEGGTVPNFESLIKNVRKML